MAREARGLNDAFTTEALVRIDWTNERQPHNHPVRLVVEPTVIRNEATGEVIATTQPGWRWYWAHSHIHLAPDSWGGSEAPDEMIPQNQAAKAIGDPQVLTAMATALMATKQVPVCP